MRMEMETVLGCERWGGALWRRTPSSACFPGAAASHWLGGAEGAPRPSWNALSILQGHTMPCLQQGVSLLAPGPRAKGRHKSLRIPCQPIHPDAGYIQTTPRMVPACVPELCGVGGVRACSPGLGRFSEAGAGGWSQGCSRAGRAGQGRGSSSILTRHVLAHLDQRNPSSDRRAGQREQWEVSGGSTGAVSLEQGLERDMGCGVCQAHKSSPGTCPASG